MPPLRKQIEDHLRTTLGIEAELSAWDGAKSLPSYLAERYEFFRTTVLGQPVLILIDESESEESATTIRKHLSQIRAKCEWPAIYVRNQVAAYNRMRLIDQGVPFLVPGNQMYLPQLGIDLREHFLKQKRRTAMFRPATQAVFIHALLREQSRPLIVGELARELGYSTMTMSRAFDEIEAAGLGESKVQNRERVLSLISPRRELWGRAQEVLSDPVKSRHFIADAPAVVRYPKAGQSALAHYSMIAEPTNAVLAISREDWVSLKRNAAVRVIPMQEAEAIEVEVWSYAPRPYRESFVVDPLSLYLSLRHNADERVEQALEQMMEKIAW